ncbi:amidohydrolase family protein [Micromonospora sp. WMMD882]|uniref:amidohydrolase family protein n=1 Tax=Micromonospora sp. WMMD882 TaxID=3015151 RepID=UPI00248C9696|nr:amidohydrolase family protein [Micromonospora sp. WMMD882]WBB80323.1 amidohydrolase family protein [Micromonospora sp. WMMD882]
MIDAHFHVWRIARGDYDWLAGEDARLRRDFTVDDWVAAGVPTPVRAGVLVQAAPTDAETEFVLSVARERPELVAGVVGWVDLAADDAAARVERLAAQPRLVGLRPWLQALDDPDWVLTPSVARGLAAIESADLVYEALARPVHLGRLVEVARRRPGLRIVVDHAAKPDIAADAFEPWASDLRRLAEAPNVVCKLSGLLTEAGDRVDAAALRPYVETVLDAFGPGRVLWGSDWPVVTTVADYASWLATATSLVPPRDHEAVFTTSAVAAYRLTVSATADQTGPEEQR